MKLNEEQKIEKENEMKNQKIEKENMAKTLNIVKEKDNITENQKKEKKIMNRTLNKNTNIKMLDMKINEIDKIISTYKERHKTIDRNERKRNFNPLKLNKTYNPKDNITYGEKISDLKKIERELSLFTKENRKYFRKALNKYKFQMEVYIPKNIDKKEYSNKKLLINDIIQIEKMNENMKRKIEPIKNETKKFSLQYSLIKSDNTSHQKTYLDNVEKLYQTNGYKKENIEYKNDENIFTPSFLLDIKFGKEQQKDESKYSNGNFDMSDKKIIKKFERAIYNKLSNKSKEEENLIIKTENHNLNEKDEEIKKEIIEEERIMNMSKKEYYNYSQKLKKDINMVKNSILELYKTENNFKNSPNEGLYSNKAEYNKTIKVSKDKNEISKRHNKIIKKMIKSKTKKIDDNNIFVSSKGLDLETDFNKRLPSINLIIGEKDEKNNENKIKNQKKIFNDSININRKKTPKLKKVQELYKFLKNKTEKEEFPYEQIENYFRNNTNRNLPQINQNIGSNIHGFVGEFQNKTNEINFIKITKGNRNIISNIKKDNYSEANINLENRVEKLGNQIKNLHYTMLEKLLANNKKELMNK